MGDTVEIEAQISEEASSMLVRAVCSLAFFLLLSLTAATPAKALNAAFLEQPSFLPADKNPAAILFKLDALAQSADSTGHTAETRIEDSHDDVSSPEGSSRRIFVVIICILSASIVYLLYIINSLSKELKTGRGGGTPQSIEGESRKAPLVESDMELPVEAHKLAVVGALVQEIFFDLNDRINNIALSADALIDDYEDLPEEERLDIATDIFKESKNAKNIVQTMSGFAMEEEVGRKPHDIPEIIEDALLLATKHIQRSKVKIKGEVRPDLPRVNCIRWNIAHVFLCIMLNALEAMPEGGTLTISCDTAEDAEFVSIEFTDVGTGIPEESLSDIFMPSFTTKPRTRALGLGLPVSLSIVKEHGGDIRVKSQVGRGSAFTIVLPAERSS